MHAPRPLRRGEIPHLFAIDRRELITHIYGVEAGALVLRAERYDMQGWPPGEAEAALPGLFDCFDRGGWFRGISGGETLAAAAVLDPKPLGREREMRQLKFLHVGRDHRGRGLARHLFELAQAEARGQGARSLYISATPSQHTVEWYLRRGCILASEVEPALFALEPEDIHLVCGV